MNTVLELISQKLKSAFTACGYEEKYGNAAVSNRPDLCQYQCNGALAAAKQYHKAPIAIAGEIAEKLNGDELFSKVEAVNPGFLNLNISNKALAEYLNDMARAENLGFEPANCGKTAIVDYGGANVAKPLHVGHLRPAIIGESVKRLLDFDGFEAIGDVHLGDWGLPMGLIITECNKRFPDLPYFDESYTGDYPKEPPFTISDLEEIYPFASAYSKEHEDYKEAARTATAELQAGNRGYRALWKHILDVSKTDLKKNYDNLNVHFELWNGESDADHLIMPMVEDLKKRGIAHISEGAVVVDVKEDSDKKEMPPCILVKSDGAAIYASTDLATLVDREAKYKPDKVIYVVDKRQGLHFEQVFRTARKAGIVRPETELFFLGNGTMNGSDGTPFKTRDGGVMRLEYLIRDISDKVLEKMADRDMDEEEAREISRMVGLAALKYGDLSNQATKDYVFDIERFTSFEGNTGPYILYTMVRIKSILEKLASADGTAIDKIRNDVNFGFIKMGQTEREYGASEIDLMLSLTGFSEAVHRAADEYAPHKICAFVYELADRFNSFYHDHKIVTQEDVNVRNEWVCLIVEVLKALEICMDLLAIKVPDRM
ncbi:MAG: arginine--tRNA ligase [Lachnospiraceae bacterium]|nr:arginine--tRNA ligase [Lachnospiraceae bacterium]